MPKFYWSYHVILIFNNRSWCDRGLARLLLDQQSVTASGLKWPLTAAEWQPMKRTLSRT